jgi:hypothetical protein
MCGDVMVHFSKPQFVEGNDKGEASKHVRGSCIFVDCYCENGGHKFRFALGFHKGQTEVWFEPIPKNHKIKDVR